MTVNEACDCSALCGACVGWSAIIKVQYTLNCARFWRVAVFCVCVCTV